MNNKNPNSITFDELHRNAISATDSGTAPMARWKARRMAVKAVRVFDNPKVLRD